MVLLQYIRSTEHLVIGDLTTKSPTLAESVRYYIPYTVLLQYIRSTEHSVIGDLTTKSRRISEILHTVHGTVTVNKIY